MANKYPWQQKQDERRQERRPIPKARVGIQRQGIKTRSVANQKSSGKKTGNSKKLGAELRVYAVLSKDFLSDHPVCQCGRIITDRQGNKAVCCKRSEEIHHRRGRGKYLNEVKYFLAVAGVCHRWIHDNDAEARALGLILSRHAIDPEDVQEVTIDHDMSHMLDAMQYAISAGGMGSGRTFKNAQNKIITDLMEGKDYEIISGPVKDDKIDAGKYLNDRMRAIIGKEFIPGGRIEGIENVNGVTEITIGMEPLLLPPMPTAPDKENFIKKPDEI